MNPLLLSREETVTLMQICLLPFKKVTRKQKEGLHTAGLIIHDKVAKTHLITPRGKQTLKHNITRFVYGIIFTALLLSSCSKQAFKEAWNEPDPCVKYQYVYWDIKRARYGVGESEWLRYPGQRCRLEPLVGPKVIIVDIKLN